ncbi:MAG: oxidoreductase [Planctomycetota bacterium]|nr:MAG: oxidoreductase [Planctomycetota bacterium]
MQRATGERAEDAAPLRGRVGLITGASSGIGRATAVALGQRGMRLTLTARRRERLEEVAAAVERAGGQALVVPADARAEPELRAVFARSDARWGRLDVLVNAAGLGLPGGFLDPDPAAAARAWRAMWEVNVLALCVATSEALRRFDPVRGGHVVHIASMAAHRVPPGGGFYAATKHAVRALTEALRQELREANSPSRVTAISPGYVATEFFEVYYGEAERAHQILGRFRVLEPEDVARQVVHVLEQPPHVEIHDVLLRPTPQPT